jgi:hypothetical protein
MHLVTQNSMKKKYRNKIAKKNEISFRPVCPPPPSISRSLNSDKALSPCFELSKVGSHEGGCWRLQVDL